MADPKKQAPLSNALSEMAPVRVQGPSSVGQRLADTRDQALSTVGNLTNSFGIPQRMANSIPSGPLQWLIPAQKAAIDARERLTKRGVSFNQKLINDVNVPDALESVNPLISAPVHYVGKILQNLDVEHEMNVSLDRAQAEQFAGQLPVDIATMSGAGKVAGIVGKSALSAGLGKAAANDALMSFIGKNIPKIEAAGRLGRNAVEGAAISGAHEGSREGATLKSTAQSAGVGAVVGPVVGHVADRLTGRALTSRPMKWTPTPRTPIASPGASVSPVEWPNLRLEAPKQTAPVKGQPLALPAPEPDNFYRGTTMFLEDLKKVYPKYDKRISIEAVRQLMQRHPAMVNVERDVINEVLEKAKAFGKVTPNAVVNALEAIFPRLMRIPQRHHVYVGHKEYFDRFLEQYDASYSSNPDDLGIVDVTFQSPDAYMPTTHIDPPKREVRVAPEFREKHAALVQERQALQQKGEAIWQEKSKIEREERALSYKLQAIEREADTKAVFQNFHNLSSGPTEADARLVLDAEAAYNELQKLPPISWRNTPADVSADYGVRKQLEERLRRGYEIALQYFDKTPFGVIQAHKDRLKNLAEDLRKLEDQAEALVAQTKPIDAQLKQLELPSSTPIGNFGHLVKHQVPGGQIIIEVQSNARGSEYLSGDAEAGVDFDDENPYEDLSPLPIKKLVENEKRHGALIDLSTNDYYKPMLSAELADAYARGDSFLLLATPETAALAQGHHAPMMQYAAMARWLSRFAPVDKSYVDPGSGLTYTKVDLTAPPKKIIKHMQAFFGSLAALGAGGAALLLGEKDAKAGVADELVVPIIVKALKKGTQKMAMSSGSISMSVDALIKDLLIHVSKDELKLLEIDGVQANMYVDAQYLTPQQDAEIRAALGAEKNTQFKKPVKDLTPAELLQVSAEEVTKKNNLEAVKGTAMDGTADLEINPKQMVKAYQQKVGHLKKEYGKNLTLADVARITGQPLERLQGNEVGAGGIGGSSFKPLLAQFKDQLVALDKAKGSAVAATLTETARVKKTTGNTINPVVDAVLQQAGTSIKEFAQIIGLPKKDTAQVYAYDPNILSQALQPDGTYGEELRMIKGKYAVIQHILEDKRLEDAAWVQFADKYNKLTPYDAVKTFESSGDLDSPLYANLYDDNVHAVMEIANTDAFDFVMDSVAGEDTVGHTARTRYIDLENMEAVSTPEGPQVLDPTIDYIADIEHKGSGVVTTIQLSGAQISAMDLLGSVNISNIQPFSNLPAAEQQAYTKALDEYLKKAGTGALGANAGQAAWQAFVKKVQPILRKHNKSLSAALDKNPIAYGTDKLLLSLDFLTRKFVKYPQLKDTVVALIERVDKVEVATNEARQMLNYGDDIAKFKQKYPVQAAQYEEVLRVFSIQKEVEPLDRANKIAQITNSLSPAGQQLFGVVQAQVTGMQRDLQTRGLLAIRAHANYSKILNATVKQGVDNFIQGKFFFNNEYVTFDRSGRYQVKIKDDQGNLIWHSGHTDRGEATKILQTFEQSMPNGKKGFLQDRTDPGRTLERPVGGRIQTTFKRVGAAAPKQVAMDAFAPTAPKDSVAQWNTELMATVENILSGQTPQFDPRMHTRSLVPGYKVTLESIYNNFIAQATALADMEARATLRNSKDKLLYGIDKSTPTRQVNLSRSLQNDARDMIDMMVTEDPHRQTTFLSDIKAAYAVLAFGANVKFVVLQICQETQMIGQVATRWSLAGMQAYATASKDLAGTWQLIKVKADDAKNMNRLVNSLKGLSLFEKQTLNHLINAGQLGAKFLDAFLDAKTGPKKFVNDGLMYLARRAELHNRLVSALTFIRIGQKLGYNTTEQIMPFVKTWMNVAAPSNEKFWLPRAIQDKNQGMQEFKELMFLFQRYIGEQTSRTVEAFEPLRDSGVKAILGMRSPKKRGNATVAPPLWWTVNAALQSGTSAVTNPLIWWTIAGGLVGGTGFAGTVVGRSIATAMGSGKEPQGADELLKKIEQMQGGRNAPLNYEMAMAGMLEKVGATPDANGAQGLLFDTQTLGAMAATGFNIQKETSPEGYLGSLVPFSWYSRLVDSAASSDNLVEYGERNLAGFGRMMGNTARTLQGQTASYVDKGERIGVPNIPLAKSIISTILQITPNEVSRRQQSYAHAASYFKVKTRLRERLKDDFSQTIETGPINVQALVDDHIRSLNYWNDAIASRFAQRPDLIKYLSYDQNSINDFEKTLNEINDERTHNPNNTREGALNKAELFGEKPKPKDVLSKYLETGQ